MGYIRLVRSGGLQACSEAIQFVPDLDDIVPLKPLAQQALLSDQTIVRNIVLVMTGTKDSSRCARKSCTISVW